MRKPQIIAGFVIQTVILCLLSYATTESINPLNLFSVENVAIRIIAYILTGLMVLTFLGLLIIRVGIPEDATCAYCGKNIRDLLGAAGYGNPKVCMNCTRHGRRTYYHGACWKAIHGQCIVCNQEANRNF